MNYFCNNNKQYIISLPLKPVLNLDMLFIDVINKQIKVSKKISIFIRANSNRLLQNQLNINNINFYIFNDEEQLLEELENIKSTYVLILQSYEDLIVNDLTNEFINKFKNISNDFIFSGQAQKILMINNFEQMKVSGVNNTLNCGIIFGKLKEIKKLINLYVNANFELANGDSSISSLMIKFNYLLGENNLLHIDANNHLFSTLCEDINALVEFDGIKTIENVNTIATKDLIYLD